MTQSTSTTNLLSFASLGDERAIRQVVDLSTYARCSLISTERKGRRDEEQ